MAGSILIVGAGAMGTAMAAALGALADPAHAMFGEVLVWSRRPTEAAALSERFGVRALGDLSELAGLDLEAVVFCVSDGAIADVALRFAEAWRKHGGASAPVALHTSGFHDVEVLACLAPLGFERGVLHPVVSLAAGLRNEGFDGVHFGVSGDESALGFVRDLAEVLGGVAVAVTPAGRPLYHAGAALLSGGMVALFGEAQAILAEALPDAQADEVRAMCLVLARSTMDNLEARSAADALTGPVKRGDQSVVDGHLASFDSSGCPKRQALYAELVRAMERLLS